MFVCHLEAPVTGRRVCEGERKLFFIHGNGRRVGNVLPPSAAEKSANILVTRLRDVKGHLLGLRCCSEGKYLGLGYFQILLSLHL